MSGSVKRHQAWLVLALLAGPALAGPREAAGMVQEANLREVVGTMANLGPRLPGSPGG
ncbi:MAG: hypothetical protein HUU35_13010, partial [Armatimonadetes bacterium]|nr:hypothetical protein [Armatimonadota bacterium]